VTNEVGAAKLASRQLRHQADALLAVARPGEALESISRAIAADPSSYEAWCTAARCHLMLDDLSSAQDAVVRALALRPGDSWALRLRAKVLMQTPTRVAAAIETARSAVAASPNDSACHHVLAEAFAAGGRSNDARAAIGRAIELKPNNAEHRGAAGLIELRAGEWKAAGRAFRDELRLNPNSWTAHNNLGIVAERRSNDIAALRHFLGAVRVRPMKTPIANLQKTAIRAILTGSYLVAIATLVTGAFVRHAGLPTRIGLAIVELILVGFGIWKYQRASRASRGVLRTALVPALSVFGVAAWLMASLVYRHGSRQPRPWRRPVAAAIGGACLGGAAFGWLIPGPIGSTVQSVAAYSVVIQAVRFTRTIIARRSEAIVVARPA
jgi:Flp pilus assembly protein TadD